ALRSRTCTTLTLGRVPDTRENLLARVRQGSRPVPHLRRPAIAPSTGDFHRPLLRARRERPCGRAAEQRYEVAPPHGAYPKAKDHGTKHSRAASRSALEFLPGVGALTSALESMRSHLSSLARREERTMRTLSERGELTGDEVDALIAAAIGSWWTPPPREDASAYP